MTAATIVLVEDNADDAELAMYALSQQNQAAGVRLLRDGAEALEYFFAAGRSASSRPDDLPGLLLLDIKLPKVDGFEVLRRIRADLRSRLLPVVMFTSSREERDIAESYRLGANSYVVKPVDFDEFSAALRAIGSYWLGLNEHAAAGVLPAEEVPG